MDKLRLLTGVLLLLLTFPAVGQVTLQPKATVPSQVGILYNQESVLTYRIHPRGMTFGWYKGKIKTYYKTTYYALELGYMRHHKETRQSNDLAAVFRGETPRPYVYGKQNSLYVLRGGYGGKRYFSEKAKRKGLAVGISYQGGITLGMIKPYYLRLIERQENNSYAIVTKKYSEENSELFLDPFSIYGGTFFTKGLGEMSFVPGVHGQITAHFAFGAFDEYVMAIDTGVLLDVFPRKVPIMVEDNQPYFLNLFITLHIGKRS
ncbi:MAG: hypothetical protein K9I85_01855 [Saprospiraceae bacterium]|nr:hypothetical protein [Saprospiraceae bacterium]